MPTYEVDLPGRGTVRVESARELTDQEVIEQATRQAPPPVRAAEFGAGRAALQGLTFGLSDEAEAQARAMMGQGTYEQNLAALAAGKRKFEEESPVASFASELAGSLPLMFAGGAAIPRAMQIAERAIPALQRVPAMASRVGGAAATGAATGAVTGAGTAEPGQRIAGAQTGAMVGGALGPTAAVAPKVIGAFPGVSSVVEAGKRAVGLTGDSARQANIKLLQALQRDGFTPKEVADKLQTIQKSGYKPETIIELGGDNTRRLADVVAQYPGASQLAASLAEERGTGQAQRVLTDFREAFRVNADATDLAENLIKSRDAAADPLYKKAYREGGVIPSEPFNDFMKLPAFKDAYNRARRLALYDGVELPPDPTKMGQLGGFDLMTLDYIKRGLDEVLYLGKQPGGGLGKTEMAKIKHKRNEFVGLVDELGPESYRAARRAFAGPTEVMDAIEQGKEFAKLDPRQIKKSLDAMTPAEQEGFKIGVYDSIQTNIAKGSDGRDVLSRVWGNDFKRKQVQSILGPDEYNKLTNQLAREKLIRQTDAKMMGGSQTQPRQQATKEFEGETELVPSMIERGPVAGGVDYLLRSMTGPGQRTAEALAPIIYSRNPQQNIENLRQLQRLDEILRQEAARAAGVSGVIGGQTGLLGE